MRILATLLAAGAMVAVAPQAQAAMPVGGLDRAIVDTNLVEQAAVYVYGGRRYCFYFNGWHGAGWYRCGFAFRRGLGWGGVYGWQGWGHGGYERRFGGRRDGGPRYGGRTRSDDGRGATMGTGRSFRGGAAPTGRGERGVNRSGGGGERGAIRGGGGSGERGAVRGGGGGGERGAVRGGGGGGGGGGAATTGGGGGGGGGRGGDGGGKMGR